MYLTKLEVVGFKSFVNKTVFDFSKGVTAIVGPNGSGKSNVADAIRWALGEQSFKNLRGKKVDDIIFSGTEKRKPLSFCEVSITFDNEDRFFPIEYNELVVTRRAYRSGENEYFINGNSCRLKDITMLLHDTGVGKEGYSIIGQNKIETLISNKSEHLREVLDEAAGVMKYKAKKEDAERKLQRTQVNIERVEDLLDAMGMQLEPLSIQSQQARLYFETRDKLKALEATSFFINYSEIDNRQKKLSDEDIEIQGNIEEYKNSLQQTTAELRELNEREKELEENAFNCQQYIMDMTGQIERQKGDAQLFEQKINYTKENNARLSGEIEELKEHKGTIQTELVSFEKEASIKQKELNDEKQVVSASKQQYEEVNSQISQSEAKIEADKTELMARLNRASEAKMQATRLDTINAGIVQRISSISAEKEHLMPMLQELKDEQEELKLNGQGLKEKQKDQSTKYNEITSRIFEIKTFKDQMQAKEREFEKTINECSSRIKIIRDMQSAYEGFNMPIKRLMQYSDSNKELKEKILGVVANVIKVPSKYAKAIESALGNALQNIISKDENDAKYIINALRDNNFGKATILPLNVIRPRLLDNNDRNALSETGCLGIASDLITCDAKFDSIIKYLLGRTIIVDNMDNAIKLARRTNHSLKLVTLLGDIINAGGSMTGGSSVGRSVGILEREQVLVEEKQKLETAKKALEDLNIKASKVGELVELEIMQQQIAQEINDCNIALAIENEKNETINSQLKEKENQIEKLTQELEQLNESKLDVEHQLSVIDRTHTTVESGSSELQKNIIEQTKKLAEIKKNIQVLLADYNEKNSHIASIEKAYAILLNEISNRENELKKIDGQIIVKQTAIEQSVNNIESMLEDNKENSGEGLAQLETLNSKKEELESIKAEMTALKQDALTLNENMQTLNVLIDEKQERRHRIELQLLKMQNDIDVAIKTLYAEFELTIEQAKEIAIKEPVKNMASTIRMLRTDLRNIGTINPNAIEDYNNIKNKFDELSAQKNDLTSAKEDLERIVKELYSSMNKQFNTEFKKLNELFNITFAEIFGGGRAEIKLLDESDTLNSQVEIITQPPGKKLENMTLLSGGESALAAISLMLSVIKLRPTPFCVLDEIEASLDEANTFKLANYIKKYSNSTQFMMITHQKASMASSDTLYGVAMEEKGISKIVSVKMEQYDREKAV